MSSTISSCSTDERGRLLIPAWSWRHSGSLSRIRGCQRSRKTRCDPTWRSGRSSGFTPSSCTWPDGQKRPLSHGDATVENVIIDDARTNASWLDFDTMHESRMDAAWRHADDLRALTYSAAARVPAASFPELTQTIVENYGSTAPLDALQEMVAYRRTRPISFHLAQARVRLSKASVAR